MIGMLVALKSILEIKAVAGALGTLDAGLNIAGLLKILRSKVKRNSIEYQIICAIDESLEEACKKLGWEYDALAVSRELDSDLLLNLTVMTKAELGRLFAVLVGPDIEDKDLDVIIDCFDKSVAGKEEVHRYLDLKWKRYTDEATQPATDFSEYYRLVEKRFTGKKRGNHKKLVGEYSDEEAYIEAFLRVGEEGVPALSCLEKWFSEENSEIMLIYGEPGHGKSTLCDKAVVDYIRGNFLKDKAKNVISVSLNTGDNHRIINDNGVDIEAALIWDRGKKTFTFDDCRGALLFMDGFDEFIDEAKKADITNIVSFMKRIDTIAFDYDIHIVVLSRTIAVNDYLNEPAIKEKSFRMMPITIDQQDDWLKEHKEYDDYQEIFSSIRDNSEEMNTLLGIPFLFRMIVNSRFDNASTNVIELYDRLTDHLLEKRNICEIDEKERVVSGLCGLAYDIYCNDTDTVTVSEKQWDTRWIFAFYIRQIRKRVIGFFHRSFYQYFLARYFYTRILNAVTADLAETIVGAFAERELDDTVRQYLSLMINEDTRVTIHNNLKLLIEALVRTEAYLNLEPRYPEGKAEKTKLGRTINVYRNTLHASAAFSYIIEKPFRDGIDVFIRVYHSDLLTIYSVENNKANLIRANLIGADLRRATLSKVDLREADLSRANLSGAILRGASLSGTNLRGADLSRATLSEADMSRANLNRAILNRATLSGATLIGVILSEVDLSGVILRGADLSEADLSAANLSRADLSKATLSGATLIGANLNTVTLSGATLIGATFSKSTLIGADLRGANLSRVILNKADLSGATLNEADLNIADLSEANLSRATLSRADLRGAELIGANLDRATLSNADLSGATLNRATLSIANLVEADLCEAELSAADLSGANLSGAILSRANLSGATLSRANLSGATLSRANLIRTTLSGAVLRGAKLIGAKLIGANLNGADLYKANLNGANLIGADLSGATLNEATLRGTNLCMADLSGATLIGVDLSGANLLGTKLDGVVFKPIFINNASINSDKKGLIDSSIKGYDTIKWVYKPKEDKVSQSGAWA